MKHVYYDYHSFLCTAFQVLPFASTNRQKILMHINNSLLQYSIFPRALKRNKAESLPPIAVTASDSRLFLVSFPQRRHLEDSCTDSEVFILFGSELLVFFNFDLFGFLSSFFVTLDPFWVVRDLSVTVEFQIKGYNLEKI